MADQNTPSTAIPIKVVSVDQTGAFANPVTIADNGDAAQGATTDAAWVSGAGTVIALLKKVASGGGGGSGPVTVIDGGDVAEGATSDAAVTTNTTGTVSGKLRGLVAILADAWDSVNHRLNVALPAATVTTLTPPAAIVGFALDSTVAKDASLTTIDTDIKAQAKLTDTQPVSIASTLTVTDASLATTNTSLTQIASNTAPQPWFMGQPTFFATGN